MTHIRRFLALLVLLGVAVESVSAVSNTVTCYSDCTSTMQAVCTLLQAGSGTCRGTYCVNSTSHVMGITTTIRTCSTSTINTPGCGETTLGVASSTACVCSTDYCNGKPGPHVVTSTSTMSTTKPSTPPPTTTTSTTVECFNSCTSKWPGMCTQQQSKGPTCTGRSCVHAISYYQDRTATLRQCAHTTHVDGCIDHTTDGVYVRACYCSTNYCNEKVNPYEVLSTTTLPVFPTVSGGPQVTCYYDCKSTHSGACQSFYNMGPTCTGKSCFHAMLYHKGYITTIRRCYANDRLTHCGKNTTESGLHIRGCYCATNYCNAKVNLYELGAATAVNTNAFYVVIALVLTISRSRLS